jgi:hypothetical protein
MKNGIDCHFHPDFYINHEERVCDFGFKCMECEKCPTYKVWYVMMRLLYKNNMEALNMLIVPEIII